MAGTEVVLMKFLLMMGRVRPPLFSDRPRSLTGQSLHLTVIRDTPNHYHHLSIGFYPSTISVSSVKT